MARMPSIVSGMAASIGIVAVVLGLLVWLDAHEKVLALLAWVDAQGPWGPVLFTLIMALVVVFLVPGVLFTVGAGFVFGVLEGTVCVVVGTTLGAVVAFAVARRFLGERAARYVRARARLQFVSDELVAEGFIIVLLTRLVPLFPFKASNYFFGLTSFSLRDFAAGTFLGIIPFSLHNVYLGSLAADLATLGAHESHRTGLEWAVYGGGFLATIVVVVHLNRLARRALAKYTRHTAREARGCPG